MPITITHLHRMDIFRIRYRIQFSSDSKQNHGNTFCNKKKRRPPCPKLPKQPSLFGLEPISKLKARNRFK